MGEYKVDSVKLDKLASYIEGLEHAEGDLINILREAQEIFGHLPAEVQLFVARKLGIPAAKVYGVATFYSYFTMQQRGKHIISVCLGTACFVKGADKIVEEFRKQLNIHDGTTTSDGMYTLDSIRCVGACGLAPVVIVDGKVHGRVKPEDVSAIIKEIGSEEPAEQTLIKQNMQ
ncbi:MAG: NAD(P)H-dependent oxidoreductase subunit [Clostridia bacterium]|jgi:NADH:ubiquinone oxidoreductase subunit E|nr:NAD(P)H-dependent oxidoreductase subunit [Clostridia bacterium]